MPRSAQVMRSAQVSARRRSPDLADLAEPADRRSPRSAVPGGTPRVFDGRGWLVVSGLGEALQDLLQTCGEAVPE